jgi:hypothetical protein
VVGVHEGEDNHIPDCSLDGFWYVDKTGGTTNNDLFIY